MNDSGGGRRGGRGFRRGERSNKGSNDEKSIEVKSSIESNERKTSIGSLPTCILCCHVIDNISRFNVVGPCEHSGCCSICILRMRQLMGTTLCPICKAECSRVICIEDDSQTFDSFPDWGDNIGPTHVFDEASSMFILKQNLPHVRQLREPICPECSKSFTNVNGLKAHVQAVHMKQYCSICIDHKKVFIQEHPLWTKEQLKVHTTKGNALEGFTGHPRCDFCFTRFYTNAELYDHLHKNHFECDICVRVLGITNRYYKDYHDLENHFRAEHFLCEEVECLRKKFVVFREHLDLQAHVAKEHPHLKTSRKIDVHFTVRRSTHNDQASDGFQNHEHLLHSNGTANDHVINVVDFPSLTGGSNSTGQMSTWESQTVTRPRMEDFPELTAAPNRGAGREGSSFRNALVPPPTAAMRAHMNNRDSWEYPDLMSAAADALGSNNPLMRFVKPAKGKMKRGNKKPSPTPSSRQEEVDEEEKAPNVENDVEDRCDLSKSALVLKIRQALGSDAKYEVFREECKKYRLAEVDTATFYTKTREMFTSEDFEKLFLKLMRLSPDKAQVEDVMAYHKSQRKQSTTSQSFKQPAQLKKTGPSAKSTSVQSGWANALRQSGITPTSQPLQRASTPPPPSSVSYFPAAPVIAVSPTEMPTSTKLTIAPVESLGNRPSSASPNSNSRPTPRSTFKHNKSDFPGLPKAAAPIGVQPVTRAMWNDQGQNIVENRPANQWGGSSNRDKKVEVGKKPSKNKKKTMSLGELAMQFS